MSRFLLFSLALGLSCSVLPSSIIAQEKKDISHASDVRTTRDGPTGGCTFEIEDLFKKVAGCIGGPVTQVTLGMIDLFSEAATWRKQDANDLKALAKPTSDAKIQYGTVIFFNEEMGFGVITPEDGGRGVLIDANGLNDEIQAGDEVSYEMKEGKKGLNAVNVKVI